jgi:hypothetical protein
LFSYYLQYNNKFTQWDSPYYEAISLLLSSYLISYNTADSCLATNSLHNNKVISHGRAHREKPEAYFAAISVQTA